MSSTVILRPKSEPIPIPKVEIQKVEDLRTMSEKDLQSFFNKQRLISLQRHEEECPRMYCDEEYQKADKCCYSQFTSTDWRRRELSIRATEAIIKLIEEIFIVNLPLKHLRGDPSSRSFHEQIMLPKKLFTKADLISKMRGFHHEKMSENPGKVLLTDLVRRITNIFETWMNDLLQNIKTELGQYRREANLRTILYEPLACEVARRSFKSEKGLALVESLVEPYLEESGSPGTHDLIIDGNRETFSW